MGTTSETIDYEAVLADLRSRRDQLNATIAGIEQLMGVGRFAGTSGPGAANGSGGEASTTESVAAASTGDQLPKEVQSDTFFNLSAVEGAKKYLRIVKRPTAMKEIHDALLAGGYLTQSKNFYSNLYTAIMRNKEFQKVGKKWGLSEWYEGRRPPESAIPRRRRKVRRRSKAKRRVKSVATTEATRTTKLGGDTPAA